MKKILIILSCLFCANVVLGQQQEHYSMYMMNYYLVNPAEGGTDDYVDLKLGYRTQWVGLEGAPKTLFLSGHAAINKHETKDESVQQLPYHGAGGAVISDQIGPYNITTIKGSYAYHLPVSKKLTVSLGAFLGVKQYKMDINLLESDKDGTIDPVAENTATSIVPDASAGLWMVYDKKIFGGFSAFQLLGNSINMSDVDAASLKGTLARHYFGTVGYNIKLNDKFNLVPSIVAKAVAPAPVSIDVNAKFRYQDQAWIGLSYRNQDAVIGMVGITLKKLVDVAYAFDFNMSELKTYNSGTHEILIGLRLPNHQHTPPPSQFW
jgi:type IX secretion system PorP/SprF family membrane protein